MTFRRILAALSLIVVAVNGATLPSGTTGSTLVIQGSNFGTGQSLASERVPQTDWHRVRTI